MTIDEFLRVELRVGIVHAVERVEGSNKLRKLLVNAGDVGEDGVARPRQIIVGIGTAYAVEELVNKQVVIMANLDPKFLMGFESQRMLLAAKDKSGEPRLLTAQEEVSPGIKIG